MTDKTAVFVAVSALAARLVVRFVALRIEIDPAGFLAGPDAVEAHQSLC